MSEHMIKELEQIMLENETPLSLEDLTIEDLRDGMTEEDAAYERAVVSNLVRSF